SPVGASASCEKRAYSPVPLHVRPSQSVSLSDPSTCGSRLYGGSTGAFGSCSVWKLCARTSTDHGPDVAASPASRGSDFCDVIARRSAKSAKYVLSDTLFRFQNALSHGANCSVCVHASA